MKDDNKIQQNLSQLSCLKKSEGSPFSCCSQFLSHGKSIFLPASVVWLPKQISSVIAEQMDEEIKKKTAMQYAL